MVQAFIPASLRTLTGGAQVVEIEAATLRELVAALDSQYPGIRARLCDGDALRSGLAVAINNRVLDRSLDRQLQTLDEVHFVAAVPGG